jgi:predicted nucleic acid-binding protein
MPVVLDASALVELLLQSDRAPAVLQVIGSTELTAPDVINLEVLSTLLPAVWELRANVTSYDACYVALAEALGCTLVTADLKLSRAPGLGVPLITV